MLACVCPEIAVSKTMPSPPSGAVHDIHDLTDSFHQAISTVDDDDEDVQPAPEELRQPDDEGSSILSDRTLQRLQGEDTQLEIGLKVGNSVTHLSPSPDAPWSGPCVRKSGGDCGGIACSVYRQLTSRWSSSLLAQRRASQTSGAASAKWPRASQPMCVN